MADSPLPQTVRRHLATDAIVELARKLMAVPSFTAEGEEQAAQVLGSFLSRATVPFETHPVPGFGVNLLATLPGQSSELGLLLNGHLDVVPASSSMPYPPFEGRLADGKLWGRGSVDMKGSLAAMACAVSAIRAAEIPLRLSAMLTAVAGEEQGNRGTDVLVRQGITARWAVVGEATGLDLVIAHKGVERYQVIVQGKAAHESTPDRGVNAIVLAAHAIVALESELFPRARRQTHAILGTATYNIGTIHGGISRNTVPDRCVFQIAKRWVPGDSPAAIKSEIEAAVRRVLPESAVSVAREPEFDLIPHHPLSIKPDHPLVTTLANTVRAVIGREPEQRGMAAFTDAALLQSAGIPTVVFGPGDIALAHSDQESIALSELQQAAEIYAAFILAVCGPEG